MFNSDYSWVRGFNYQPSYCSTNFELWRNFNPEIIELELRRGKEYFPDINTIRVWFSWDAFVKNPAVFEENFETLLKIVDKLGMKLIPILFNRWHIENDNGGIYLDHFIPEFDWLCKENLFYPYIKSLVGNHANDERILLWDICNEPFPGKKYRMDTPLMKELWQLEYNWLAKMYGTCKEMGATQPVSVSITLESGLRCFEDVSEISDVHLVHPYYFYSTEDTEKRNEWLAMLDGYVKIAQKTGKGIFCTEACWGSLDNDWRLENMKFTLPECKKRGIGWVAHALNFSYAANLHPAEDGPLDRWVPKDFSFILKDGSLRPGHEIFNNY